MANSSLRQVCRVLGVVAMLASTAPLWAAEEDTGGKVVSSRQDGKLHLGNTHVTVVFDEENGTWDAVWRDDVNAAVRRAASTVKVDGRRLTSQAATGETAPLDDGLGHGMELRQRWGKEIEIERRIRLYDGLPAVVLSVQITNHADHDVALAR